MFLGLVKAEAEANGQHARMCGNYQGNQHFSLSESGKHLRAASNWIHPILCPWVATVQVEPSCCHSS